jgi:hypothetical protein
LHLLREALLRQLDCTLLLGWVQIRLGPNALAGPHTLVLQHHWDPSKAITARAARKARDSWAARDQLVS